MSTELSNTDKLREFVEELKKLKIDILGKMHEATILEDSPYDAENKLLRA